MGVGELKPAILFGNAATANAAAEDLMKALRSRRVRARANGYSPIKTNTCGTGEIVRAAVTNCKMPVLASTNETQEERGLNKFETKWETHKLPPYPLLQRLPLASAQP
jgi:hypothetical protein